MRRALRIAPVLALLLAAAACGPPGVVDVPLSYPLKVGGALQNTGSGSFPGTGPTVDQTLQNQGVSKSMVASAELTSATLTQTQPTSSQCNGLAGCDLSFIGSLEISVGATGQHDAKVASINDPKPVRKVNLVLESVDLAPYVTASSMTLSATMKPKQQPPQEVDMTLDAVLRVHVKL